MSSLRYFSLILKVWIFHSHKPNTINEKLFCLSIIWLKSLIPSCFVWYNENSINSTWIAFGNSSITIYCIVHLKFLKGAVDNWRHEWIPIIWPFLHMIQKRLILLPIFCPFSGCDRFDVIWVSAGYPLCCKSSSYPLCLRFAVVWGLAILFVWGLMLYEVWLSSLL